MEKVLEAGVQVILDSRLFEIAPEVKPLFKGDMKSQGRKLMTMLNRVVRSLNDLEKIVPAVQDSGGDILGIVLRMNIMQVLQKRCCGL